MVLGPSTTTTTTIQQHNNNTTRAHGSIENSCTRFHYRYSAELLEFHTSVAVPSAAVAVPSAAVAVPSADQRRRKANTQSRHGMAGQALHATAPKQCGHPWRKDSAARHIRYRHVTSHTGTSRRSTPHTATSWHIASQRRQRPRMNLIDIVYLDNCIELNEYMHT